jgi:hypothetical protein
MKKLMVLSIAGFIVLTAFNTPAPADYRDAYTGTYFCKQKSNTSSNGNRESVITVDTISIVITKDVLDSVLQINLGHQTIKVKLINKTLQAFPIYGHYGGSFFAADSIDFYFAPGRISSYHYTGKKK